MAITTVQETGILKIVVGLFNAAPGGVYLAEMASLVESSMTINQLADALAVHPFFTNGIMAGKVNADMQAAVLVKNFGLVTDNSATSAGSQAFKYFKDAIDAEIGFGQIVYQAIEYLSGSPAPEFSEAAALLANKVLVADDYSKTHSSLDLRQLQAVLSDVTSKDPYPIPCDPASCDPFLTDAQFMKTNITSTSHEDWFSGEFNAAILTSISASNQINSDWYGYV